MKTPCSKPFFLASLFGDSDPLEKLGRSDKASKSCDPMVSYPFPITFPENAPMDQLAKCTLITRWYRAVDPALHIDKVAVITADSFGPRIGLIELEVWYTANQFQHTERLILTGSAVMMIVVFKCIETGVLYTILVQQPRLGSGKLMYEFPAGMTDGSDDSPAVAARELQEEVGITVNPGDLIRLSELYRPEQPFTYLSPSHYDNVTLCYLHLAKLSKAEIDSFQGRHCGAEIDEQIQLTVIPLDQVVKYAEEPATIATYLMVRSCFERGLITV
jgi:8-oxo-dGTP pyrophosphatase MutT (NUDIX family)